MASERADTVTPEDDAFVNAFSTGQIPNWGFHHRDHLRLAWVQIQRLGLDLASTFVTESIRHFAAHHGAADRYNETMTRFWMRVVAMAIRLHPALPFEDLLAAEPHLLDKTLVFRHWSRERIGAADTRARWVEPDLRPMPA